MDHGAFSPLSMMMKHEGEWEYPIVPLQVGVLEVPVPSAKRCYKLGQSLRKAIMSYPEDLKVVIVSTGGLSHQVHGERSGYNNEPWDRQFLDMITDDPVRLSEITIADYVRLGGQEGAEVIMWLISEMPTRSESTWKSRKKNATMPVHRCSRYIQLRRYG